MGRIVWDALVDRRYEIGLDRGVVYPRSGGGVPWNGLISIRENAQVLYSSERYFNGLKYDRRSSSDSFGGTIQAFTYPEELENGPFHLSYRTLEFNESTGESYLLHLVYNVVANMAPTDRLTVNPDVKGSALEWDFTTKPVAIPDARPSAHILVRSSVAYNEAFVELENVLYGTEIEPARFPSPSEVLEIFEKHSLLRVFDNGDGTWTAVGPDEAIEMLTSDVFQITWPSAVYLSDQAYRLSSL